MIFIQLRYKQLSNLNKKRGSKNILKRFINRLQDQFIAIGYIYKTDIGEIREFQGETAYEFIKINESDLDIMKKNYAKEFDEKKRLDLLSKIKTQNTDGFIVKKDGNICGYFFLSYGRSNSDVEKKYIDMNKNGYIFNDYVFEKYRGNKIQQYSIYKRLGILKEKQFKTATSAIEYDNLPSIKSYEKYDFKRYLVKLYFRFGNNIKSKTIIKPYKKI